MRRSLSLIAAMTIVLGASAMSLSPADAAMPRHSAVTPDSAINLVIKVGNWDYGHGDGHNAFRDDDWGGGWRHRRHYRHRYYSRHRSYPFYFGFPFAFKPHFYPYNSYGDCFRTWDGQLICRGY